ncbi:hypothetical protein D3C85_748980 [compost metagenome]
MSNEVNEIQDFTPQDTKAIQIQSVCAFMEVLGYTLHVDGKFYADTFWDYHKGGRSRPTFKGCEVLSFNTCVKLHNGGYTDWGGHNFREPFVTDKYTFNKARAAKVVQQVFLQGTKHGNIVCHKHLVRFVDPSYQYLFLKDESVGQA